ncbi:hydantoinase/oxoprolinase family protein [Hoeflea prorocentri]|uniref:Hydantoinase/oxoprolinase family protein n=1 Tax=Hoeflea prorocentri TaxID=1922333 RepID=A0A9X3ZJG0_9HYPH|nr:hydantoinase/oxoprolinase family protein [Hoeflea prorocentri]MCY6382921.1 hydantoinase/oxoprolinase family protein [Hoeflea prorocentri]MDA5400721.1 hydantoinase/oxoprolinase family protein [Hoeflea prorocentri]
MFLGIDTGGTYTDAVLFSPDDGVVAKAKALTTRHDLTIGIGEAASRVLKDGSAAAKSIELVSLSTTLATNALVEGQGDRAALIMIGFDENDLQKDGLADALGSDPVIFLPGGHDVHGRARTLDLSALEEQLEELGESVAAFAIAGYFAVRNPEHEIAVRDRVRTKTGLPATCSHELSSRLGGPRRALTTLLNARLVAMIDRLIDATQAHLSASGIAAPLMVVRGDGALIASDLARARPIETILSGPAASLVGARYLTGMSDAVVSDIGGTTTDVAILEDGQPRLDPDGAIVGGYRTMVQAVAMHTFGLGGDSEVHVSDTGLETQIRLGPRRLMPLSLAAHLDPEPVIAALKRQLSTDQTGRLDGRFACRTGVPNRLAAALQPQEAALYERIKDKLLPLDELLSATPQRATLDRLAARGLVHIAGFTPSDAMHVLGRQDNWNGEAARLGAGLLARRKNGAGKAIAQDAEDLAEQTIARLTRQSCEVILTTCLADDGETQIDAARSRSVGRALDRAHGVVKFALTLDRPLIGLGASAASYYPAIARMLNSDSAVPPHADVANAVGAVAGHVRTSVIVFVTAPQEDVFAVNGAGISEQYRSEGEAMSRARELAREAAEQEVAMAGAEEPVIRLAEEIKAPEVEGMRSFVEARVTATADGRPRITRDDGSDRSAE